MSEVNKYSKGKIYTIRCRTDDSLVFVGSTSQQYICKRFASHKNNCKIGRSGSLYKHITDNDWSDWYIELHENYPCNSRDELCRREGEVIREIGTINKNIAGRTQNESSRNWQANNRDKHLKSCKNWRENNRDKHLENVKRWYDNNRDKKLEFMKRWRENNPNYMKEWHARKRSTTL
jgi:hypothetical protein